MKFTKIELAVFKKYREIRCDDPDWSAEWARNELAKNGAIMREKMRQTIRLIWFMYQGFAGHWEENIPNESIASLNKFAQHLDWYGPRIHRFDQQWWNMCVNRAEAKLFWDILSDPEDESILQAYSRAIWAAGGLKIGGERINVKYDVEYDIFSVADENPAR
jgi:hypothetical protein